MKSRCPYNSIMVCEDYTNKCNSKPCDMLAFVINTRNSLLELKEKTNMTTEMEIKLKSIEKTFGEESSVYKKWDAVDTDGTGHEIESITPKYEDGKHYVIIRRGDNAVVLTKEMFFAVADMLKGEVDE